MAPLACFSPIPVNCGGGGAGGTTILSVDHYGFFVAPQFHQWTITVSVHGYLFQEVRDWISIWKEVVFVRKRLFFSILSPVNDHSSKKEKDGTFRFWDFSFFYLLYLLWFFRLVFYLAKPLICYENVITVTEIWDRPQTNTLTLRFSQVSTENNILI